MDYPKFIVLNQKEESISIQRINHYPINIICPENVVCFLHLQVLIRLDFIMGSALTLWTLKG